MGIRQVRLWLCLAVSSASFGCGESNPEPDASTRQDAAFDGSNTDASRLDVVARDAEQVGDIRTLDGGRPDGNADVQVPPDADLPADGSRPLHRGDLLWDALYEAALAPVDDDTRWVALDGVDDNPCTSAQPCATILRALETIEAGGQIVVRDGHYIDRAGMRVNDNTDNGPGEHRGRVVPSGHGRDLRTVIRAETRFGVRITFNTRLGLNFGNEWVRLGNAEYVWVDGFIVDWLGDGGDPQYMVQLGRENILSRCILRRDAVGDYGGMVTMGSENSHSLIQDVHGVGGGRYQVQTGPGTNGTGGRGIVRRAVFRFDYAGSNQPLATFAHYGNNSGDGSQGTVFQNSIAIDGPNINTGIGTYSYKWGSYYNPKNALDVFYQGAMSIREGAVTAFWVNDNVGNPQTRAEDILVIGADLMSGARASVGNSVVNRATVANAGSRCFVGDPLQVSDSECLDEVPAQIIGRTEGARLTHAYGTFLSVWGEPGFDQVTDTPLWPFPYESIIQAVFAEPLPAPSGYSPRTNDTTRGFCGGSSIDGHPMTLTRYIYELGGSATPPEVYE